MALYFHWPLGEILDLEHPLRRSFVGQIEAITTAGITTAGITTAGVQAGG